MIKLLVSIKTAAGLPAGTSLGTCSVSYEDEIFRLSVTAASADPHIR